MNGSQGRAKMNTGRQATMVGYHKREMVDDRCDEEDRSNEVMDVYTDADFQGFGGMNTCGCCGKRWEVTQEEINKFRAWSPPEYLPMTDDDARNLIEFCTDCAGIGDEDSHS